ncbi:hypothetical protein CHS0354_032239 [Potamilus streckersoni]|uniref:Small ribosomal subunit protein bS6m n=1 Tax=Potamilus streckersoni TaxID=2493646 RepID=A0AAE0RPQ5_9BIVA|nr:hypothetical protein CHS0354_032239 [Potamilus streckersoni]
MPSYEVALILRSALERVQLSAALKRTCQVVFDNGGTIRSLENLGLRQLPYAMKSHGHRSKHGNYFIINFDSSPSAVKSVGKTLNIDEDIIRQTIILKEKDFKRPCLDGSCVFGELPNPDHEKFVHKESLQRKLFPKKKVTSILSKQLLGSK